jgi:stage III sporulation protein AE
LGVDTVREISEYGRLLLPVMTASMAAQGGVTTSAALYAGTAFFDALLSGIISSVIVPMLYVFLCLSVASCATGEEILGKLTGIIKWAMTWSLKIILYVFTGYMGITGVISGTTDAAAMKATKLTISGMVPVVGGILSDASESVLVGAGVMKSAVGMYGALALLAICAEPFLRIGIQYLLLKATGVVCEMFGSKQLTALIQNFCAAMGILLAMTGSVCLLLLISTVCFMKGVG